VKNVVVYGNEKVDAKDIQKLVLSNTSVEFFRFWKIEIRSSSIFLVNKNNLQKQILTGFSTIDRVVISKNYPKTLTVEITERKPIGAYCGSSNQCYLIDPNGVVFQQLPGVPDGTTIIRQLTDNAQIYDGQKVMTSDVVDAIYKIQTNLKNNFQMDAKEASITSQVRLNVLTSEGWQIYFDLDSGYDINSQLTKLDLLLSGGPEGISVNSRKNLRYIDLRPKDRAIICDNKTCGS
jgi:cell division septal protein FtsQ